MTEEPSVLKSGTTLNMTKSLVDMLQKKKDSFTGDEIVCFDVDECLVEWFGDGKNENSKRRKHVAPLYEAVNDLGLKKYIITARPKTFGGLAFLKDQLRTLGYNPDGFVELYMMPKEFDDPGIFKSEARKHIMNKTGRDIFLMVGDQATDVLRDPSRSKIKFDPKKGYIVSNSDYGLRLGFKVSEIS